MGFRKKLGIKTIKVLKIIRDASSLGENKEGNTQGMRDFREKIRDKNYQSSENKKDVSNLQIQKSLLHHKVCIFEW